MADVKPYVMMDNIISKSVVIVLFYHNFWQIVLIIVAYFILYYILFILYILYFRTSMSVQHISWLLEFCLKSTYFSFQGRFYQQLEGTAMGSPFSPIIANLFMEDLETRALNTSQHPPSLWKRHVDDTLTIIKKDHKDTFLDHINSIDPNIKFTSEDPQEDTLSTYPHHPRRKWQTQHHCLQEAHPH